MSSDQPKKRKRFQGETNIQRGMRGVPQATWDEARIKRRRNKAEKEICDADRAVNDDNSDGMLGYDANIDVESVHNVEDVSNYLMGEGNDDSDLNQQLSSTSSPSLSNENELLALATGFLPLISNFSIIADRTQKLEAIIAQRMFPTDDGLRLCNRLEDLRAANNVPDRRIIPDVTVGNFHRGLSTLFYKHNLSAQSQFEIVDWLRRTLPVSINIRPTRPPQRRYQSKSKVYLLNDYTVYSEPDYITYDTCRGGCCVYVGPNARCHQCPVCHQERYRSVCKSCKSSVFCEHGSRYRTAFSVLQYRSLIFLLINLIKKFPKFVDLCRYINKQGIAVSNPYVTEFMGGNVASFELQGMQKNFDNWLKSDVESRADNYQPLNLLLGEFYDGVQLFTHRITPFSPLLVSVLNLPPHLRGKLGIGTFLLSIISCDKERNAVEEFLYRDCLVAELEALANGIEVTAENGRRYLLQARMVMHCLDTPALCKMLHVQGKGSYSGCPLCRCFPGTFRKAFNKAFLYDHRQLLDYKHILRYFGQTQFCCPGNYYGYSSKDFTVARGSPAHENLLACLKVDNYSSQQMDLKNRTSEAINQFFNKWCLGSSNESANVVRQVESFLRSRVEKNWIVHLNGFDWIEFFNLFGQSLYYAYGNYRQKSNYSRISNRKYLEDAATYHRRLNDTTLSKQEKTHYNGVRGVWDFARLAYADVQRHVCWDPFHAVKGVYDIIMDNILGNRAQNSGTKEWCYLTGTHPTLWLERTPPVYVLNAEEQLLIEAIMNCLLFPSGVKRNYDVYNPISQRQIMRGHGKMLMITTFLDYLLFESNLPQPYKDGLSVYSSLLSKLLSPVIKKDSIDDLWKQLVEATCILEGLFPESESMIYNHQVIDVVGQVKEFGPVQGWWAYYGERAMGMIKRHIPKGGQNYTYSTYAKYVNHERCLTEGYYDNDLSASSVEDDDGSDDEERAEDSVFLSRRPQDNQYEFNAFNSFTKEQILDEPDYGITEYDLFSLLDAILREIEQRVSSFEEALKRSPLYYLVQFYKINVKEINSPNLYDFLHWLYVSFPIWKESIEIDQRVLADLEPPEVKAFFDQGTIFRASIAAGESLMALKVQMYKKSFIYGKLFKCRGFDCRESKDPIVVSNWASDISKRAPANVDNYLKTSWSKKEQFSCWCKFLIQKRQNNNQNFYSSASYQGGRQYGQFYNATSLDSRFYCTYYAQINVFIVLQLPVDPLVHGMNLASVTCRQAKPAYSNNRMSSLVNLSYISAVEHESFLPFVSFIPVSHIYPTNIAVAGFQSRMGQPDLPIMAKAKRATNNNSKMLPAGSNIDYIRVVDMDRSGADVLDHFRLQGGLQNDHTGEGEFFCAWNCAELVARAENSAMEREMVQQGEGECSNQPSVANEQQTPSALGLLFGDVEDEA